MQPKNNIPCDYFPACGGCHFLDLDEQTYHKTKEDLLPSLPQKIDWIWVGPHARRKVILQISPKNIIGFFQAKSKKIIPISNCFTAEKAIADFITPLQTFLNKQEQNLFTQASITAFDNGLDIIFKIKKPLSFTQEQKILTFAKETNINISYNIHHEIFPILLHRPNHIFYPDFKIELASNIFIQATKKGLNSIITLIRDFLLAHPHIKNIADIYAGFGAYSFAIADLATSITAFEGDQKMTNLTQKNITANNLGRIIKAKNHDLFLSPIHKRDLTHFDLAIINPPRNGASPQIKELAQSPVKHIMYVSCNPQTFQHDAQILIDSAFKITKITALDQFYATKHLELIAIFEKTST